LFGFLFLFLDFAIHNQIPLGKIRPIDSSVKETINALVKTLPAHKHSATEVGMEIRSTAVRFSAIHFFIEKFARVKCAVAGNINDVNNKMGNIAMNENSVPCAAPPSSAPLHATTPPRAIIPARLSAVVFIDASFIFFLFCDAGR
jgi:hypothetical protein